MSVSQLVLFFAGIPRSRGCLERLKEKQPMERRKGGTHEIDAKNLAIWQGVEVAGNKGLNLPSPEGLRKFFCIINLAKPLECENGPNNSP